MTQRAFPLSMLMLLKGLFSRLNFSRQFMVVSFAVLVTGMITIGSWIGHQIESNTVNRAAAIATVYVESILATQIRAYTSGGGIDSETRSALDRGLGGGPLRRNAGRCELS